MQDHYDKREDLGNCFETAQEEEELAKSAELADSAKSAELAPS